MKMTWAFRLCLTSLVVATGSAASLAQLVFIPDTAMRTWLNGEIPGVVDADGYLDTAEPALASVSHAHLEVTWGPSDLTGLQYLAGLDGLELHYGAGSEGQAQVIPAWPPNILFLDLGGYSSEELPSFPTGLAELNLNSCPLIAQLPPLPEGLVTLGLGHLPMLSSLTLPTTLSHLNCAYELPLLLALPALPASMTSMSLHGLSSLSSLPALPYGFASLEMSATPMLTALPELPETLQALRLGAGVDVPLAALPGALTELQLVDVPIPVLPELPPTLETLYLSDIAELQSVPPLPPGLSEIYLFGLPLLTCLPQVPDTVQLNIWFSGLTCLPNHPIVPDMDAWGYVPYADYWGSNALPLCTVLNSVCPNNNGAMTGHVYHDLDGDGIRDPGEGGWGLATLLIEPGGVLAGVDTSGYFEIGMPDGAYAMSAQANSTYVTGVSPALHAADLANFEADSLNDFGIQAMPGVTDLELDLTLSMAFVPGATRYAVLTCQNTGTETISAHAALTVGDGVTIIYMDPLPTSSSDNTAEWTLGAMPPGSIRVVQAHLLTDISAQIGMPIQVTAELLPTVDDVTPLNNTAAIVDTVLASYDPNDKRVQPSVLTPSQVTQGQDLEYTIRFQNTGTYQASRVVITDTLSEALQWNTMRFISSSHACSWLLTSAGVLRFTFDPILLPDSNSNEPESHGFVKFAMRPSSDLALGESVGNTANIYFDFNEPVITNEAVFSIEQSTAVEERGNVGLVLWPNPANDYLVLEGTRPGEQIEMMDATGRTVGRWNATSDRIKLDMGGRPPGIYSLRAVGTGELRTVSFVKG